APKVVERHNRLGDHVEVLRRDVARDRDHVVAELSKLPRVAGAARIAAVLRAIRRDAAFEVIELRLVTEEDMRHRGAVVEGVGALYDRLGLSLSAVVLKGRK